MMYGQGSRNISLLGQPMTIDAQKEIGYVRAAQVQTHNVLFRDEVPQLLTVMSHLADGVTFVDIGANVGLWTITAASILQTHASGQVISFEANPDTFGRLKANVAGFANVTAHNVAVSDKSEQLRFFGGATSGVFSTQKGDFNTPDAVSIEARPVDDLLAGHDDIVLKIDVEGHEAPVLRGLGRIFDQGRVRAAFIDGYDPSGEAEIIALFERHGFRLFDARTREPWTAVAGHVPLLAVRTR